MASPASPAETRAFILERLVGDTGEPDQVIESARALTERALSGIVDQINASIGASVTLEIRGIEVARFADAKPTDGASHAMTIVSSTSSPDAMILLLDPQAISIVVSALFGGDPDMPAPQILRDLSPTETEVAAVVFDAVATALNGSGDRSFNVRFPLHPPITGIELKKHIIRDGPAVRINLAMVTAGGSGTISILMPQRVLLKHRGDASAASAGQEAPPAVDWRARFSEEVMRSSVSLEATMPLARMTLGEISDLHVGQVLDIEVAAQSEALLSARNKTLFVCEFGKLGQNYTVRIRHPHDADQGFLDGLMQA